MLAHSANGALPADLKPLYRSGLQLAGDKGKLGEDGIPLARPIVIPTAFRRLTAIAICAQMKDAFAKPLRKLRQLGLGVPAGVEIAFKTVELSLTRMEEESYGDLSAGPTALQYDLKSAYNNVDRKAMMSKALSRFPTLARMLHLLYGEAGKLFFVSRGELVESFEYSHGVLQGCPLGLHGLCLALWDFFEQLDVYIKSINATAVWIADDLTIVVAKKHAAPLIQWVSQGLTQHHMHLSTGKLYAYMPGIPHEHYSDILRSNGFRVSQQGLHRLLGAPIGTRMWLASDTGQLANITNDAIKFLVQSIPNIKHIQARYHMLRWSACTLLLHLGRLVAPQSLLSYTTRFDDALNIVASDLLATTTLTHEQLQIVKTPTKQAGLGLGGPLQTMQHAFAASAGEVARFYRDPTIGWHDRTQLAQMLAARPSVIAAASEVNEDLRRSRRGARLLLNPTAPQFWPRQQHLAQIIATQRANDLEERLTKVDGQLASWFASGRQMGGSGFLAAIPSLPCFRVSSSVFQTMLCMRLLSDIPGTSQIRQCSCGDAHTPFLRNGTHWISSCEDCSQSSVRHNKLIPIITRALREIKRPITEGETANWLRRNRSIRPFDIVTTGPALEEPGRAQ